jgi:hypothetical protein
MVHYLFSLPPHRAYKNTLQPHPSVSLSNFHILPEYI